jgi:hypothetical protein
VKNPLKILLFLLIALTFLSGFQKIFGLSARPPAWPSPQSLRLSGYQVSLLSTRAGSIGRDFSTGTMRRFRVQPLDDGPALDLTTMPVNSIKPDILQLPKITHDRPTFFLKHPRLISHSSADHPRGHKDELALSTVQGRTRLQTCLMRSGKAGYGRSTLGDAWVQDNLRRFDAQPSRKVVDYLIRLLSLQPIKLSECLVVQLETEQSPGAQERLLKAWTTLKSQLLEQQRSYPGALPSKL